MIFVPHTWKSQQPPKIARYESDSLTLIIVLPSGKHQNKLYKKNISLLSPPSHLPSRPAAVPFVFPIWVYWSFYNLLLPLFCQRLMDIGSKIEPFRRKMHQKRTFAKVLGQNPIADQFEAARMLAPCPHQVTTACANFVKL